MIDFLKGEVAPLVLAGVLDLSGVALEESIVLDLLGIIAETKVYSIF